VSTGHQVLKFTQDGQFLMQIGKPSSSKAARLGNPGCGQDVSLTADNEVYVADGYGNHRVIVYDADTGKYKRHWGAYVTFPMTRTRVTKPDAPALSSSQPRHCADLSVESLV